MSLLTYRDRPVHLGPYPFDLVRDGAVNPQEREMPDDPTERAQHLKAAGYYFDASMMGVCARPYDAQATDAVEHRDVVLSQTQQQHTIIVCCSRAQHAGGVIVLDF